MKIEKIIDFNELNIIKESYKKDFPSIERIPYWHLKRLVKKKILEVLFLKQEEEFCGYMITVQTENNYIIIEYFAILEKHRSKGYGSECLKLCKDYYNNKKGILIEAEKRGAGKDDEDNLKRKRRINFYRKNGYQFTKVLATLFDTEYEVWVDNRDNSVIEQKEIIQTEKEKCEKLLGKKLAEQKCKFQKENK